MPLHAPTTRVVPEVVDDARDRSERPVRLRSGHVHPGITESDDVRPAVTRGVGQEPRMPLHPPSTGNVAEIGDHPRHRTERPTGLRPRHVHPCITETDDVSPAVPGRIRQEPRMPLDPPPTGNVAEI